MKKTYLGVLFLAVLVSTGATTAGDREVELNQSIKKGDVARVHALLAGGADANAIDADGTPALMNAVIYGNAAMVRVLLDRGANPNAKDKVGSTALIQGAGDPEKARLLIHAGADVNAQSGTGRTALHMAATVSGGAEVVKMLLDKGAKVDVKDNVNPIPVLFTGGGKATALTEAGRTGDLASIKMLVAAGAQVNTTDPRGVTVLSEAVLYGRGDVVKWLLDNGAGVNNRIAAFELPILSLAAMRGDVAVGKMLIARGAELNQKDKTGSTPLMWSVAGDQDNHDFTQLLLRAGADMNVRNAAGETALDWAQRRGMSRPTKVLLAAGAAKGPIGESTNVGKLLNAMGPSLKNTAIGHDSPGGDIRLAMDILAKGSTGSAKKTGCATCHHQTLPLVLYGAAQRKGIAVDKEAAVKMMNLTVGALKPATPIMLEGSDVVPDLAVSGPHFLEALAAQGYAADRMTAALVHCIATKQAADGRWVGWAPRAPLESGDIQATALAIRALQLYPLPGRKAEMDARIRRAGMWLRTASAYTTEDMTMRLLGLRWSQLGSGVVMEAARALVHAQKADGGFAPLPTLNADAYSTAKAIYALRVVYGDTEFSDTFKKGIRYLRQTQQPDGSWKVVTRSVAVQPLVDTGFPHGRDQWISAAATSWAGLALVLAEEPSRVAMR